MSREFEPEEDPEQPEGGSEPPGHVRPTGPGALVGFALTGLVLGWLLRPVSVGIGGAAPTVGWLPVAALFFVALIMGAVAWSTHRTLRRHRQRLEAYQAVNRLVLAKACALVGALVGGGYLGYALSYLGRMESDLAEERVLHSLLAGLAGVLIVTGSLLLERACRVQGPDDRHLR